ncbi:hypothetical protein [Arthrobacter rhizosphaerae]|uniref:hypothetical protein n=1 Tax=Arthrobacter rhizosphaerae TaxID=2855490 RepID=UPI001FF68DA8|nr:hypothetical protein [Arthrobacter rhizosphaerae]
MVGEAHPWIDSLWKDGGSFHEAEATASEQGAISLEVDSQGAAACRCLLGKQFIFA